MKTICFWLKLYKKRMNITVSRQLEGGRSVIVATQTVRLIQLTQINSVLLIIILLFTAG